MHNEKVFPFQDFKKKDKQKNNGEIVEQQEQNQTDHRNQGGYERANVYENLKEMKGKLNILNMNLPRYFYKLTRQRVAKI